MKVSPVGYATEIYCCLCPTLPAHSNPNSLWF